MYNLGGWFFGAGDGSAAGFPDWLLILGASRFVFPAPVGSRFNLSNTILKHRHRKLLTSKVQRWFVNGVYGRYITAVYMGGISKVYRYIWYTAGVGLPGLAERKLRCVKTKQMI